MLELGAGAGILRSLGWLYSGLIVVLVGVALWFPERWWQKTVSVAVVLLIFTGPAYLRSHERSQIVDERKARYKAAKALFDERCKTAGEKIYRTAEGVEGVMLSNVRPEDKGTNRANPNWPDAGLPDEAGGVGYISSFLSWEHQQFPPRRGYLNGESTNLSGYPVSPGYAFADVREADGAIYRYRFRKPPSSELSRTPLKGKAARYAVAFSNKTDPADRAMWVAGTTVAITDTQTNELMAEHTWYSFEPGQGSTEGFRSPWGFAKSCPESRGWRGGATRMFVDQVLKPTKGE